jgi:hypothetical protein
MLTWEDTTVDTAAVMAAGRHRSRRAALAVLVLVGGPFVLVSMQMAQSRDAPGRWQPTAAQTSLAQRVALTEANSMNPDAIASASTDHWPANVTSVNFADGPGDRDVLVIQMRGTFQFIASSVPPGVDPVMTRRVITLVVDAATGDVVDFSASDSAPKLADSVPLRL